jgi:hypothetical protein
LENKRAECQKTKQKVANNGFLNDERMKNFGCGIDQGNLTAVKLTKCRI